MNRPRLRFVKFVAVGLVACAIPAVAAGSSPAEEGRILSDRYYVAIGGFLVDFRTDAQVGVGGSVGSFIRLEDQLGVEEDRTDLRIDGHFRLKGKHTLEYAYLSLDRVGDTVLDEEIEFEGTTYSVGADLATDFRNSLFRVSYKYSLFNNGEIDAGVSAGISAFDFTIGLDGEATVDDGMGGTTTQPIMVQESILAPVPAFGMFMSYAITPKLIFRGDAQFFDLETGDFEGRLVDTKFTLDYFFSQHVGVGGGISTTDLRFNDVGDDPFGVNYRYTGLLVYLSLAF